MMSIQSRSGGGDVVGASVRLPRDLRDELKIRAIKAGRSLNTHIVMVLSAAVRDDDKAVS